jgi:hypothetical protein
MQSKQLKETEIPEGFWELVRATMVRIYDADSRRASRLKKDIGALDAKRRAIFYHTDPLSVAANLSDRAISDEDAEAYRRLPEWRVYAGLESPSATELIVTDREVRVPESRRRVTRAELAREVAGETKLNARDVRKVLNVTFMAIRRLGASTQPVRPKAAGRVAKR